MDNPLAIPPRTLSALIRRVHRALPDITLRAGALIYYPGHPGNAPWAVSHHEGGPKGFRIGWSLIGYDEGLGRWTVYGDSTVEAAAKASGFILVSFRSKTVRGEGEVYLRPLP